MLHSSSILPPRRRVGLVTGMTLPLVLVCITSFAIETARMELPADFESAAERATIEGFGGWNKGSYTFLDYRGEFARGESRLGIFDPLYVSSKGRSSFTLAGADGGEEFAADCEMKKGAVTVGIVSFDPKKMSYRCEFRRDGLLTDAQFVLGQPKYASMKERLLAKDQRRGEAVILGKHFVIESVHRYRGTKFTSQAPVGYVLRFGDDIAGAVELTDVNPTVYLTRGQEADLRQAASIVALALAVLRDPAHSAMEE